MKLRIYGGLRGAAQYGVDAEITLERALLDGYRIWIDPEGWYVGDPTSRCRWSGWQAKPINETAETPLVDRIGHPAVIVNPDCRDGKHDACNGDGWDTRLDAVTDCPCTCHEPKEGR